MMIFDEEYDDEQQKMNDDFKEEIKNGLDQFGPEAMTIFIEGTIGTIVKHLVLNYDVYWDEEEKLEFVFFHIVRMSSVFQLLCDEADERGDIDEHFYPKPEDVYEFIKKSESKSYHNEALDMFERTFQMWHAKKGLDFTRAIQKHPSQFDNEKETEVNNQFADIVFNSYFEGLLGEEE